MMRVLLKCWSDAGLATRAKACEKKKKNFFSKVLWMFFSHMNLCSKLYYDFLFIDLKEEFKWECFKEIFMKSYVFKHGL